MKKQHTAIYFLLILAILSSIVISAKVLSVISLGSDTRRIDIRIKFRKIY